MPVFSTTSTCLESQKNLYREKIKSCVWSLSRDKETYIFHTFDSNFLFISLSVLPASQTQLQLFLSCSLSHTTFSASHSSKQQPKVGELTGSKNRFIFLMKLVYLSSFNLLNLSWMLISPTTYRHKYSVKGQKHTSLLCTF